MSTHPAGLTVDVVGISSHNQGRSCECHGMCGEVVKEDVVVRFRKVQVVVKGQGEDTVIVVYWVMEGIDRCCVGFLPKHLVMCAERYNGVLAQVIGVYPAATDHESKYVREKVHKNKGFVEVAIISEMKSAEKVGTKKGRKSNNSDNDNESNSK
jgi:hypothetical protein